jgi:hypothetical protein
LGVRGVAYIEEGFDEVDCEVGKLDRWLTGGFGGRCGGGGLEGRSGD